MKKLLVLFLAVMLVFSGCGAQNTDEDQGSNGAAEQTESGNLDAADDSETVGNDDVDNEESSETQNDIASNEGEQINVDKGILNVEITLPASMFEDQDMDTIIAEAKEDGVEKVTKNDDGSVTYSMSKSAYNQIMQEMKEEFASFVDDMKNGEDFVSIKDIEYNDDLSDITLIVEQEKYENSFDAFASLGIGIQGMYYQIFEGTDPENTKVTISVKDMDTGEVFDTIVFPDSLKDQ